MGWDGMGWAQNFWECCGVCDRFTHSREAGKRRMMGWIGKDGMGWASTPGLDGLTSFEGLLGCVMVAQGG